MRTLACTLTAVGLLALSSTADAACERQFSGNELARFLSTADVAFVDLDDQTFRQALVQARQSIPCLSEPLSTSQASAYHRAEAFQAFLDRDHTGAVQSFRAMLRASPGMLLSEDFAPQGHPLRIDFEIAEGLPSAATRAVPLPDGSVAYVDGMEATVAPDSLPFVLQIIDPDGALTVSTLVDTGASLPDTGVVIEESTGGRERAGASSQRSKLRAPLVATAVVAAVTSASLYGMSTSRQAEFWDPTTPDSELQSLRRQSNTMASVSLGAGIVAVGTGTAAVLSFTW